MICLPTFLPERFKFPTPEEGNSPVSRNSRKMSRSWYDTCKLLASGRKHARMREGLFRWVGSFVTIGSRTFKYSTYCQMPVCSLKKKKAKGVSTSRNIVSTGSECGPGVPRLPAVVGSSLTKFSQILVPIQYLIMRVFDQLCASIHFSLVMVVTGEKKKPRVLQILKLKQKRLVSP